MKHLKIRKLHAENFQKFQRVEFDFSTDHLVVRGENRAGKTTIQSAMTWLLFGKDAYGQTDTGRGAFDIKRRVNGETIPHTDVTVEGHFDLIADNQVQKIRLKRVLHECWNKKNEYTGDETQCFVNDVPYKVSDYQDYISSIIQEDEFRMISTVGYFNSLKTDFKRNYLCAMAGVQEMEEFVNASGNDSWKQFIKDISGKSLEEKLKQISYERKQLKKIYESIDPQIQSLEKVMPEELDWIELDEQLAAEKQKRALLDESIANVNKAMQLHNDETASIRKQASDARAEFYTITKKIEEAKQKALSDARDELYKKDRERIEKQNQLAAAQRDLGMLRATIEKLNIDVKRYRNNMDELVDEYNKQQSIVFQAREDNVMCPLLKGHICSSPELMKKLEEDKLQAEQDFNIRQQEIISLILKSGRNSKTLKDNAEKELASAEEQEASTLRMIETLETIIAGMPEYSSKDIDESSLVIPGREQLEEKRMQANARIAELEAKVDSMMEHNTPDNTSELKAQRAEVDVRIESLIRQLTSRQQIDKMTQEIERLNAQGKEIAGQIAALDLQEVTAKEISRAIMEDATMRVNKLFDITTWQMFELQKNGLYAEVCKPCIDGVSNSLNTEARINIGIDICNAIAIFRGFAAPVFIDNAESVNNLLASVGQRIEMYVAPKGTELTITNY